MDRFTNFDEEIRRGNEKQIPHTPPTKDQKQNPFESRFINREEERY